MICRLPDVLGKPIVRIVEDVCFHPHYSDMVPQVPDPKYYPTTVTLMIPCPSRYDRGVDYPQNVPWHVWLTEPNHAIYDGWAVEILGFEGDAPDYVPQPHSLQQSTDLIQRQRDYLQRVRPLQRVKKSEEPVPVEDVPVEDSEPRGAKPVPSNTGSSGWLCPKGRFYPCLAWGHTEWEAVHGRWFSPYDLQSEGWVIVSAGFLKGSDALTQDQLDTLFDLGLFSSVEIYNSLLSRP
jgi:hypothetical protein